MTSQRNQRGFTLIVALIVLVVATLLVVGAIAFTGSERTAAASMVRSEVLNACTHAARNMFLSRVTFQNVIVGRVGDDTGNVALDAGISLTKPENDPNAPQEGLHIYSGHFDNSASVNLTDVVKLEPNQVAGSSTQVQDLSNRLTGDVPGAGYYNITATCRDTSTGAQQEIEFLVRVGL